MAFDRETHRALQFNNNPGSSFPSHNVNSGVYLMSRSVLEIFEEAFDSKHVAASKEVLFLEHDILPRLVGKGALFVYQTNAFWSQVKTAASAVYANRHYLKLARGTGFLSLPEAGEMGLGWGGLEWTEGRKSRVDARTRERV